MSSNPLPSTDMLAVTMARRSAAPPVNLLDVLSPDGTSYHWATMNIPSAAARGITPIFTGTTPAWNWHLRIVTWDDTYLPWLLQSGPFHLSRSMQSNVGNFALQNLSGSTLQRDMSKLITGAVFEGAQFAYREWNLDAQQVEFEFHGRLTVVDVNEITAQFAADNRFNPSNVQGLDIYSETCEWRYASPACSDTTNNPCQHSFTTCRQQARFRGVINTFTSLQTPSQSNVSTRMMVRRRQV